MERTARRPSRSPLPAVTASVALALVACGGTPSSTRSATAGLPDLEQSLAAHEWLLDPGDSSLAAGSEPVTLAFPGPTAASGAAPCNTYRGAVTLDGDDGVRVDDIATTLVHCEPDVAAAEDEYLEALAQVRTADVTDRDRLVLTSDGVRLSFTAVDVEALLVGDLALTGVGTGCTTSRTLSPLDDAGHVVLTARRA